MHEELTRLFRPQKVYFQPPQSIKMQYPCIRYAKVGIVNKRADNGTYGYVTRYEIIAIDSDPDSNVCDIMLNHFPMCTFDRGFTADNLNHFVFTLYY